MASGLKSALEAVDDMTHHHHYRLWVSTTSSLISGYADSREPAALDSESRFWTFERDGSM